MATSTAIINAARDQDIRERAIAIASAEGIADPQSFVNSHMYELATAKVDDDSGQTIADVLDYSRKSKKQKREELEAEISKLQEPGADLASVTDEHLQYALKTLHAE